MPTVPAPTIETDYLIIGAGAVGMAFADTMLDEDPDAHITLVDRHAKPGGHWNDAYPFVALHQPASYYGLNSTPLGNNQIDTDGPNKGYYELATGTEVCAYYERVMNTRFLPSGRVAYLPMTDYLGNHRISGILSGEERAVKVRRKVVDATYYNTSVPATHTRRFTVAQGTQIAIPNDLPGLWMRSNEIPAHYAILGAGKTAMDVAVWLLRSGVPQDNITWVRPRETWMFNRANTQSGPAFFEQLMQAQLTLMNAVADAETADDLFLKLERDDFMLRIDPDVLPTKFHFPVISHGELELLRSVKNVVRMGRLTAIAPGELMFPTGTVAVPENTLFVDCTATAVAVRETRPQFEDGLITLQMMHVPLVALNAAVAAFIEANFDNDADKNTLGEVSAFVDSAHEYPIALLTTTMNRIRWSMSKPISDWLAKSRLDPAGPLIASLPKGDPRFALLGKVQDATRAALPNLHRLAALGALPAAPQDRSR
ncbi:NAD(P)-binding protein [Altererythrobacter confluentis]|uniref:NAD(P)-binding protein n=1 Tax=Allopontixanthobacter confluentis TaxID=1849021 RepID=A0A6L7GL29_9SPHN|nr:NAD(P)-binding protein [Allopontixanthobacter confluentis]MXP15588.1 NAD(P)-binding protein [Allopontixanthobacter confluentis]